MNRLDQIQSTDYMRVAEQLYRHQNPNGAMDTPSSVYETIHKWYKEWLMEDTELSLFDWCIKTKN